jgi:homoserine kinase
MATINRNISPEERQANIDALINHLVTSKRETQAEMQRDYLNNPRKKQLVEELKQKNTASRANKGI